MWEGKIRKRSCLFQSCTSLVIAFFFHLCRLCTPFRGKYNPCRMTWQGTQASSDRCTCTCTCMLCSSFFPGEWVGHWVAKLLIKLGDWDLIVCLLSLSLSLPPSLPPSLSPPLSPLLSSYSFTLLWLLHILTTKTALFSRTPTHINILSHIFTLWWYTKSKQALRQLGYIWSLHYVLIFQSSTPYTCPASTRPHTCTCRVLIS